MKKRVPVWARAVLAADRAIDRGRRALESVRDAVLFGALDEDGREAINEAVYGSMSSCVPGGAAFERGLFDWEERAFAHPTFPKIGTLLLGGAGGGRELTALIGRGFDVIAFEPSEPLYRAASKLAVLEGGASRFLSGGYRDLILAADGRGPLAEVRKMTFDGVVLGWTSLSYVPPGMRAPLFRALRSLAPTAPVLASFWGMETSREAPGAPLPSIARALRSRVPKGASFAPTTGFIYRIERAEIERLASDFGYALSLFDLRTYPHVIMVPR